MIITPRAALDIENAARWYEREMPGLGDRFLDQLDATLNRIEQTPLIYRQRRGSVRPAMMRRFPLAVYFAIRDSEVHVLSVLHHAREGIIGES